MTPIRVCIADDHRLFRSGLRMLLSSDARLALVGEAASADEAVQVVAETQPDILLLDLSMPGTPFQTTIEHVRQKSPSTKIVVLTMHDNMDYVKSALIAGATSYLTKGIAEAELIPTLLAVCEGRTVVNLCGDVKLQEMLIPHESETRSIPAPHLSGLSLREKEVVQLVAQGFTSAQIAEKLFLSVKTIETYRSRLMTKLGLKSRAELVQYAAEDRSE